MRVDEIRYCAEQLEARRMVLQSGVLPPALLASGRSPVKVLPGG